MAGSARAVPPALPVLSLRSRDKPSRALGSDHEPCARRRGGGGDARQWLGSGAGMRVPSIWWQSLPRGKGYISRAHAVSVDLVEIDAATQGLHLARPCISCGSDIRWGGPGRLRGLPSLTLVCLYIGVHILQIRFQVRVRHELGLMLKGAAERVPCGVPDLPTGMPGSPSLGWLAPKPS